MKRIGALLIAASALMGTMASAQGTDGGTAAFEAYHRTIRADPQLDEARTLINGGNLSAAIDRLQTYTEAQPGSGEAWFLLGVAYGKADREQAGLAALGRAVRAKPELAALLQPYGTPPPPEERCTAIKMPWDKVDPCAGRQSVDVEPVPAADPAGQAACTEIKMPWDKVDPCAGRQRADGQPAPVPQPAQGACTEIKMPWDKVDPCAGRERSDVQPGQPAMPAPAPVREPVQVAGGFKVGDVVEFDKFSDERWGRFGRIVRLNSTPGAPCPWYFVEEAGSGITSTYVCHRVRPARQAQLDEEVRANQPRLPTGAPPLGHYFCHYGVGRQQLLGPGRNFYLMAGGQYAADDGDRGTYSYDPASGRISFSGGFFGRMDAVGEFKGGQPVQIDIHPAGGLLSYCSLQ